AAWSRAPTRSAPTRCPASARRSIPRTSRSRATSKATSRSRRCGACVHPTPTRRFPLRPSARCSVSRARPVRGSLPFAAVTALLLALAVSVGARAQPAVDLQLVLAVDASGSVDQVRFELQKRGYVAAFRHARVLQAIRSGPNQAIAVTMMQWTGPMMQVPVAGWTRIGDEESAAALAAAIERAPRQLFGGGTSISGAIDFASTLFPKSPFRGGRRVIDVSGDGSNNRGRPVTMARDEAVAVGIAINGLPILALEPDLDRYYYDSVIGGPGAFV